jgi:epoxyqueuosine reductase
MKGELYDRARELGFARMGVARAETLEPEGERLRAWLHEGRHGSMRWMEDTAEVRADPRHEGMLPSARSVVVLVTPYARPQADRVGPSPGRVARYARGRDYHNVVHKRMRKLAALLREGGHHARASVDTLPVFERAWAERAGVGFIGKNCCLIVPGLGSHVFLSCLVTSAELEPDEPMKQRCGSCRLCLDACPTDAFVGARRLDARRCISYQTIEQPGSIPHELREPLGDWIFGCDVCQDVCPFNRTRPPPEAHTEPFAPDPRWDEHDAQDLLTMDEARFAEWARGSPIKRPGRDGMARNAAVVLGNRGERRHLPVLQQAAREHPSEVVREAASWASGRIAERPGEDQSQSSGGSGNPT